MKVWSLSVLALGAVIVTGCGQSGLPRLPTLVTVDPNAEINAWPLGATHGTLTIEKNCIRLNQQPKQTQMLTLVFPPGYKLRQFQQGWAVVTSNADVWGVVGKERQVGGGELNDGPHVSLFVADEIQKECTGPYWLVTPEDPSERQPRNVQPPPPPSIDS